MFVLQPEVKTRLLYSVTPICETSVKGPSMVMVVLPIRQTLLAVPPV